MPRPAAHLRSALFVAILAGVASPSTLRAQDAPARPPRERLTSLDTGPLTRSDAVVVGALRVLVPAGRLAPQVARVEVEAVLHGTTAKAITVFIGGPKNTLDRQRPSVDVLEGRTEGRFLLFLAHSRAGSGYDVVNLFPAEDALGREKAEVLARELAVAAVPDVEERARRTLSLLLDLLAAPSAWGRLHASGDLELLAEARPALFTRDVLVEIAALRQRAYDPTVRARLDRAVGLVTRANPEVAPPPPPAAARAAPRGASAPAAGAEFLRARRRLADPLDEPARIAALTEIARLGGALAGPDLVATLEGAPEAAVRERAAVLLGDVGARDMLPRALEAYARESDPAVREALLRAAGILGDETTVAWVEARRDDPTLLRPVCFALARLRTPRALATLEELRVAALRATPTDEGTARLVVYLRGPAFVEAERVAGRVVGPRAAGTEAGSGGGAGTTGPCAPEGDGPR